MSDISIVTFRHLLLLLAAVLLLHGCASNLRLKLTLDHQPGDIPMSGRVPERVFTDTSVFSFPLTLAWEYDASAGFGNGAPVVVGNTLITGTLQGEIHAVDMETGKRLRYIRNFSPISSSPVVFRRFVIFGIESTEENLIAIDTDDGSHRWAKDAGGVAASPLLTDTLLFVGGLDGSFTCYEAAYGSVLWRAETGAPIRSAPCAWNGLVISANSEGVVNAYRIADGTTAWTFAARNAVFAGLTAAEGVVFVASRDSTLYLLDAESGIERRRFTMNDKIISSPAVDRGRVYIPCLDGTVSAYSVSDGSLLWKFRAKAAVNTTPLITPNAIFVASLDQHLYALSPVDGSILWKHSLESRVKTTPLVWNNSLIIASEDRNIRCFR